MNINEKKCIVTSNSWFYGNDGKKYRAAWGTVNVYTDDSILGIKTNRNSTDWFVTVGKDPYTAIIAGCQVHQCVICKNKPDFNTINEIIYDDNSYKSISRDNEIYIAE